MADVLMQDFIVSARALRHRPGFALVAVLTLALGIGASTAIFSVVRGVLLKPLPYPEAGRIGILWHEFGSGAQNLPLVHPLDVRDYRDCSELFDNFTVATGFENILGDADNPEIVDVGRAEAGFFEFFGAVPIHGRTFSRQDDTPGAAPVTVLSHRLWERRFGSDPAIVGNVITVNGAEIEVVGVLPASFRLQLPPEALFLRDAEVWTTARIDPSNEPTRNVTFYTGFARLGAGVTFQQAQQEIEVIEAQLKAEHPIHADANLQARIVPLLDDVVKDAEATLFLLLSAVGFVLLIACANVANLLIVRGHARGQEYSLRTALGANKGSLVRLALVESALLAGAGAGLGGLLAWGCVEALKVVGAASVPRLESVQIDGVVLLFAVGVTVGSATLFGLVPALRTTATDPAQLVVSSTAGRRDRRFRDLLIVGEIAACLMLLIGTGLMVRSFAELMSVQPGYSTGGALTFRVSLPAGQFGERESRRAFVDELWAGLRRLPRVTGVSAISQLPLTGSGPMQPFAYDEETASNWESVSADSRTIAPGFFEVVGAEVVSGRGFDSTDIGGPNVVIIDDQLAERAFPGQDAVGQALQVNPNDRPEEQRYAQVIGVVSHLRLHHLSRPHHMQLYWPMNGARRFSVIVRTAGAPEALVAGVRAEVSRLAPGAPIEDIRAIEELVGDALGPTRLALGVMAAFGLVAMLLASVGIYGVLSYAVAQRTREIGIRMALGQKPAAIRWVVLSEGARLVAVAIAVGLGGAVAVSGLVSTLLYEVTPLDPVTYLVMTGVLVLAAGLACWVPAGRATRVDPLIALRGN